MKKIMILFFFTIIYLSIYAQLKHADTLTYAKMMSKTSRFFENGMDVKVYIADDKNTYKIGDTLVIGAPSGINKTRQYDGGVDNTYEFIYYGTGAGILLKGVRHVEKRYQDYKLTIFEIIFYHGMENAISFYTKPLPNTDFTIIDKYIMITMVDYAIKRGEIIPLHPTRKMTRDEAIKYLKSKKDELDLDIITKEQYDKIKTELMPILK